MVAAPARFPMPHPNGWFCVALSDDVKRGEVLRTKAFGRELVVWRGQDGEARVVDAYCPHLGAHLGVGGVVVGDSIRCPFHGWRFGGDGACVEAPYAQKTPRCSLGTWPTVERNGAILVWHHALGDAADVDVPVLDELGADARAWSTPLRRHWLVKSHPQEMGENSVDSAHFVYVHGTVDKPTCEVDTSDAAVFHVVNRTRTRRFGRVIDSSIDIRIYGPGISIVRFREHAEVLLLAFTTPLDEQTVEQRFTFTAKKSGNPLLRLVISSLFMREVGRQFEQDTPIWENKKHLVKPVLCDGDGPIWQYRRWYQRFYSTPPVGGALRTLA